MLEIIASTPSYQKAVGKAGEPKTLITVQEFEINTGAKFPLIATLKVDAGYSIGTKLTFHPSSWTINGYGNIELNRYPVLMPFPSASNKAA